ncbi:hypothetical protein [Streptococcus sp. 2106]|uniref:hypothetical protein n=1 Tax=Streptococcus sp. 2106 TaxID=2582642 RepID=UPI0015629169|nr:hypothetical protein [Streptococcus sp. 2106]
MPELQNNFKPTTSNVSSIHASKTSLKTVPIQNNDIIEVTRELEEQYMANDTYTKTEIDLKLDKINSDTQHGFEKVDLKFDQVRTEMRDGFENIGLRMEKMFSDFKLEQQKEKEENKKWLIALTIGSLLSIIGIVVSIIAILVQK